LVLCPKDVVYGQEWSCCCHSDPRSSPLISSQPSMQLLDSLSWCLCGRFFDSIPFFWDKDSNLIAIIRSDTSDRFSPFFLCFWDKSRFEIVVVVVIVVVVAFDWCWQFRM
jgi:hypothetical protein